MTLAVGYRKNVAALVKCGGQYLGCLRATDLSWQCVQGGCEEEDSSLEVALARELCEELGLSSNSFKIVVRSHTWRRYRFPNGLISRPGMNFLGQDQMWFLVELNDLGCVSLEASTGEFSEVKLCSLEELQNEYVWWKKAAFIDFCDELRLV